MMQYTRAENKVVMPTNVNLDRHRNRKVVFYGRVSTEHEAQISALENQLQWYDDQAKYHHNWTVLRKYIDEGITGTQAKKRPSFMEMVADAKKREFDLIVTREVCRFARNTVDTLVTTRELKEYGVEVYFVEDNIWTMDGDGELRLSLMATLAQEESRKTSERVRAGQKISRDKGVLYGNGNIIGYDRVDGTYVINEEQAYTVRKIYELYSKGYGQKRICNELCRLHCKDGVGKVSWSCSKISRILRNATYKGYKCYLKSFCNNYLDQKRVKNLDESTYLYVKGDFEPIVSEELWDYCNNLRKKKNIAFQDENGIIRFVGKKQTDDPFLHKLRCVCGSTFRKNRWHQRKDGSWSYGYRCYNAINNGMKRTRIANGLDGTGYCDGPMICDWKFVIMAKKIFSELWSNRTETIIRAYELINENYVEEQSVSKEQIAGVEAKIEKEKNRIKRLLEMRMDGEIDKEEFAQAKISCEEHIKKFQEELTLINNSDTIETRKTIDLERIRAKLEKLSNFEDGNVPNEIIEEFVAAIVPDEDGIHFSWYLYLDDNNYEQKICSIEGRKNTLSLDVKSVEDDGQEQEITKFQNSFFLQTEGIGKNPYQRGVLHRLTSKTPDNRLIG